MTKIVLMLPALEITLLKFASNIHVLKKLKNF